MRDIWFLTIVVFILLSSCSSTDEMPDHSSALHYQFQDGFESNNDEFDDLFPADGSRWTNIQQVDPNSGVNQIELDKGVVKEGDSALKMVSNPSDAILSKVDIEKGGFSAPLGSTLTIKAAFYIEEGENLKDLFLIDLECCSCWDPAVGDNQCPGIRLKLSGDEHYLSIERGKILNATIQQTTIPFPMNQWVEVKWIMTLNDDESGQNILMIDGEEVINVTGSNMPNAEAFRAEFAQNGIDFELQSPLAYERLQIGATANPTDNLIVLYVDDFELRIE